jgi:hypothetical protein
VYNYNGKKLGSFYDKTKGKTKEKLQKGRASRSKVLVLSQPWNTAYGGGNLFL